jgi:hypothetical protein
LPSAVPGTVTVQDDADYIRDHLLIPILEHEEHDIVLLMHSYDGVTVSVAARDLGKSERTAQGKNTGILGQKYMASMLVKGGDGSHIVSAFGGEYPVHIVPNGRSIPGNFCSLIKDSPSPRATLYTAMNASHISIKMSRQTWQMLLLSPERHWV